MTLECDVCGLPDPYAGNGDGIGSCGCPRCECGEAALSEFCTCPPSEDDLLDPWGDDGLPNVPLGGVADQGFDATGGAW